MSDTIVKAPTKRHATVVRDISYDPLMLKLPLIPSMQQFNNFLRSDKEYILRKLTKKVMLTFNYLKKLSGC